MIRFCTWFLLLALAPASPSLAQDLTLPPEFWVLHFQEDIDRPTSMAFGPDGWLYVASLGGTITAIKDLDGNGNADTTTVFATGFTHPLGLAHRGGYLYVSSLGRISRLPDANGNHVADSVEILVTGIPYGRSQNNGIAFSSQGLLYVTVGASNNIGVQPHPWHSTILRFTATGAFVDIFATGLRNPYDLAFDASGQLYATENAPGGTSTWPCYEAPDELNRIQQGNNYGFPYCIGFGDCVDVSEDCDPPPCGQDDCNWGSGCEPGMVAPIWTFEPHSSSNGVCFGAGFPPFTDKDVFVAQWGQQEPVPGCNTGYGRKVVRVHLSEQTQLPVFEEDFITGFTSPLDLVVGPDQALYVCDYTWDTIYRVKLRGTGIDAPPLETPGGFSVRLEGNPTRTRAVLRLSGAPPGAPADVSIYDVTGRRVRRMEGLDGGEAIAWDLEDGAGRRVPGGIYLMRVVVAGVEGSVKVLVEE